MKKLISRYNIKDITQDHNEVEPGSAFFAIKGNTFDGNNFINDAFEKGANVVFTDNPDLNNDHVIYLDNIRSKVIEAAELIYNDLPKYITAVTGTNGKTSTVHYFRQICELLGEKSGSIGTLGIIGIDFNSNLTTNNLITTRKILSKFKKHGVDYVALEASSHGMVQNRLKNLQFDAAAFTNITKDHIDYHESFDNYLNAKLKLFKENLNGKAIFNDSIPYYDIDALRVGYSSKCSLSIKVLDNNIKGQDVEIKYNNKHYQFHTSILGSFQIENILMAGLLTESCGFDFDDIIKIIPKLVPPPGRLDRVGNAFIDYAHTPDALEKALTTLKLYSKHNLILVFGSGGDRDKEKRPLMGKIACKYADIVIITDDNPRYEKAENIRKEIIKGCNKDIIEIGGRKLAIEHSMQIAQKDDIILIAGKGHETYQIIGDKKIYFNDKQIVQNIYDLERGRII